MHELKDTTHWVINITDIKNNKHTVKRSLHYNEYMFTEEINL